MTSTEHATSQHYAVDAVRAAAVSRDEPEWLIERRAEAARAFAALPMPTPALRPWKYTDITSLDLDAFAPATPAWRIAGDAPERGFVGALGVAAGSHAQLVREHLGAVVGSTDSKLVAANAARWEAGALIHAPRSAVFAKPVVIECDAQAEDATAIYPRLLIVADEASEVTVVLRNRSGVAPLLVLSVIEIVAGPHARVRLLIDDRWGEATQEFLMLRSRLDRAADVDVASLALGGVLLKQTAEALIEGEGANSTIRAVALGDGKQHFDFVTLQDHIGTRTTSNVEIKAALAGASKSIYYGVTRVEETAAGAEANQQNRNLLLSAQSKADSDPVLEILTADVIRCGHGATVGPVDEEPLFYLQTRGLDRRTALQLLVTGFFRSVMDGVGLDDLAEELDEVVFAKLGAAEL